MVQWKEFTAKFGTWEGLENLKNTKEAVKEFEKEYWWNIEDIQKQKQEKRIFRREELPKRFIVRKLFG